jgi:hypothetical protein
MGHQRSKSLQDVSGDGQALSTEQLLGSAEQQLGPAQQQLGPAQQQLIRRMGEKLPGALKLMRKSGRKVGHWAW